MEVARRIVAGHVLETGIPIPPRRRGYIAALKALWVDESVFLPVDIDSASKLAWQAPGTGNYKLRQ
jgi:hypothetical protein